MKTFCRRENHLSLQTFSKFNVDFLISGSTNFLIWRCTFQDSFNRSSRCCISICRVAFFLRRGCCNLHFLKFRKFFGCKVGIYLFQLRKLSYKSFFLSIPLSPTLYYDICPIFYFLNLLAINKVKLFKLTPCAIYITFLIFFGLWQNNFQIARDKFFYR